MERSIPFTFQAVSLSPNSHNADQQNLYAASSLPIARTPHANMYNHPDTLPLPLCYHVEIQTVHSLDSFASASLHSSFKSTTLSCFPTIFPPVIVKQTTPRAILTMWHKF